MHARVCLCCKILVKMAREGFPEKITFELTTKVKEQAMPTCDKRGNRKCKGPEISVCPLYSKQQGEEGQMLLSLPLYRWGTEDQRTEVTWSRSQSKQVEVPGLEARTSDIRSDGSTETSQWAITACHAWIKMTVRACLSLSRAGKQGVLQHSPKVTGTLSGLWTRT